MMATAAAKAPPGAPAFKEESEVNPRPGDSNEGHEEAAGESMKGHHEAAGESMEGHDEAAGDKSHDGAAGDEYHDEVAGESMEGHDEAAGDEYHDKAPGESMEGHDEGHGEAAGESTEGHDEAAGESMEGHDEGHGEAMMDDEVPGESMAGHNDADFWLQDAEEAGMEGHGEGYEEPGNEVQESDVWMEDNEAPNPQCSRILAPRGSAGFYYRPQRPTSEALPGKGQAYSKGKFVGKGTGGAWGKGKALNKGKWGAKGNKGFGKGGKQGRNPPEFNEPPQLRMCNMCGQQAYFRKGHCKNPFCALKGNAT
jgi:hypothetical protein